MEDTVADCFVSELSGRYVESNELTGEPGDIFTRVDKGILVGRKHVQPDLITKGMQLSVKSESEDQRH